MVIKILISIVIYFFLLFIFCCCRVASDADKYLEDFKDEKVSNNNYDQ